MGKPLAFEHNGKQVTLERLVEESALNIGAALYKDEKRVEEIMQDCKILNSLSTALIAIKM